VDESADAVERPLSPWLLEHADKVPEVTTNAIKSKVRFIEIPPSLLRPGPKV
jgi:hypothetical protein